MRIQVLTFRADGLSERDMIRQSAIVALALRDFAGVRESSSLTDPRTAVFGAVVVWDDAASLDRFRHSELYARLMLHPHLADASDQEVAVDVHAEPWKLLLAA